MPYVKSPYKRKMASRVKSTRKPRSNGVKVSKPAINPQLKSYVKRMVKSTEEKKFANLEVAYRAHILGTGFDNAAVPTAYGYTTNFNIIPPLTAGTGVANRIGNKVNPTSCFIRGYLRASPITAVGGTNSWPNEPFYVRVVLYRMKSSMTTNVNSDILDNGNGTEGFDGTLDGMLLPYSKEKFLIAYSRTFKLQAPAGTVGTNVNNDIGGLPVAKFFKIKVPLPKTLSYVDVQTDPSNARWYLAAGVVNTSGNIAAATDIRCTITAESVMYFTDA